MSLRPLITKFPQKFTQREIAGVPCYVATYAKTGAKLDEEVRLKQLFTEQQPGKPYTEYADWVVNFCSDKNFLLAQLELYVFPVDETITVSDILSVIDAQELEELLDFFGRSLNGQTETNESSEVSGKKRKKKTATE